MEQNVENAINFLTDAIERLRNGDIDAALDAIWEAKDELTDGT